MNLFKNKLQVHRAESHTNTGADSPENTLPDMAGVPTENMSRQPMQAAATGHAPTFEELFRDNTDLESNMREKGFLEADEQRGKENGLTAALERLFEVYKKKNTQKWEMGKKDQVLLNGNMAELEAKNQELARKLSRKQSQFENQQRELKEEREQLRHKLMSKDDETQLPAPTNKLLERFVWGLWGMLTLFLLLFYINTSYMAFYREFDFTDPGAVRDALENGGIFSPEAFYQPASTLVFLLVFPFVFFAMGGLLHLVLENIFGLAPGTRNKILVAVVLLTLAFDLILAAKIHLNINQLSALVNRPTEPVWESMDFYIVIFGGFVSFLFWSGLFHGVMHMRTARNPYKARLEQMNGYRKRLAKIEGSLAEGAIKSELELEELERQMSENRLKIVELEGKLNAEGEVVTYNGQLKLCLEAFYSGWLRYLNALERDTQACQAAYRRFIAERFSAGSQMQEEG